MQPAVCGSCHTDYFRCSVFNPVWDTAVEALKKNSGLSADVTRRELQLSSSRDSTFGWRTKSYSRTSTVEMMVFPRGAAYSLHGIGVYAREDAMGLTCDLVEEGDQILDGSNRYYEAVTVQEHWRMDDFAFREVQLHELPMYQAEPATTTWTLTRPNDPRERTKAYIDTNVRNTQLTRDDDNAKATWACLAMNPPYPLEREFRAAASPLHGAYVVDHPNSTPEIGHDLAAYGYVEHVPIHIMTVDSTGVSGTALQWKMEAEMRYVCENYPTGSQRTFERVRSLDRPLGSMMLYDTEYLLTYRRDTS